MKRNWNKRRILFICTLIFSALALLFLNRAYILRLNPYFNEWFHKNIYAYSFSLHTPVYLATLQREIPLKIDSPVIGIVPHEQKSSNVRTPSQKDYVIVCEKQMFYSVTPQKSNDKADVYPIRWKEAIVKAYPSFNRENLFIKTAGSKKMQDNKLSIVVSDGKEDAVVEFTGTSESGENKFFGLTVDKIHIINKNTIENEILKSHKNIHNNISYAYTVLHPNQNPEFSVVSPSRLTDKELEISCFLACRWSYLSAPKQENVSGSLLLMISDQSTRILPIDELLPYLNDRANEVIGKSPDNFDIDHLNSQKNCRTNTEAVNLIPHRDRLPYCFHAYQMERSDSLPPYSFDALATFIYLENDKYSYDKWYIDNHIFTAYCSDGFLRQWSISENYNQYRSQPIRQKRYYAQNGLPLPDIYKFRSCNSVSPSGIAKPQVIAEIPFTVNLYSEVENKLREYNYRRHPDKISYPSTGFCFDESFAYVLLQTELFKFDLRNPKHPVCGSLLPVLRSAFGSLEGVAIQSEINLGDSRSDNSQRKTLAVIAHQDENYQLLVLDVIPDKDLHGNDIITVDLTHSIQIDIEILKRGIAQSLETDYQIIIERERQKESYKKLSSDEKTQWEKNRQKERPVLPEKQEFDFWILPNKSPKTDRLVQPQPWLVACRLNSFDSVDFIGKYSFDNVQSLFFKLDSQKTTLIPWGTIRNKLCVSIYDYREARANYRPFVNYSDNDKYRFSTFCKDRVRKNSCRETWFQNEIPRVNSFSIYGYSPFYGGVSEQYLLARFFSKQYAVETGKISDDGKYFIGLCTDKMVRIWKTNIRPLPTLNDMKAENYAI